MVATQNISLILINGLFIHEKAVSWNDVTCPSSHSLKVLELGLKPGLFNSEPKFLTTILYLFSFIHFDTH